MKNICISAKYSFPKYSILYIIAIKDYGKLYVREIEYIQGEKVYVSNQIKRTQYILLR